MQTASSEERPVKGWFPRRCAHLLIETTSDNGKIIFKLFQPKQDSASKHFNMLKSHEHQPNKQNQLPFSPNEEEEEVTNKKKD